MGEGKKGKRVASVKERRKERWRRNRKREGRIRRP